MRTYNVVLLSPSAGILEMVCHSQSLTEYLVGPSQCPLKPDFANAGAHERYRPSDDVSLHLIESSLFHHLIMTISYMPEFDNIGILFTSEKKA